MTFHPTVGSIQSGPHAKGDVLASQRREVGKAVGQLQGQRVDIPAGGGGGPVGIVNIGSVEGTVIVRPAGGEIAWESVQYGTPEVVHGAGNWLTLDGSDIKLSPGWYHPVLLVWAPWAAADAPDGVSAYMGGGQDWAHQNPTEVAPVPNSTGTTLSVQRAFDHGPTYMGSGDYLRAELQFAPAAGPLMAGAYHNWTITKLA